MHTSLWNGRVGKVRVPVPRTELLHSLSLPTPTPSPATMPRPTLLSTVVDGLHHGAESLLEKEEPASDSAPLWLQHQVYFLLDMGKWFSDEFFLIK